MATPEVLAEKRELAGINADYKEKFGFHDSESGYAYKAPKGLTREVVETISDASGRFVDRVVLPARARRYPPGHPGRSRGPCALS